MENKKIKLDEFHYHEALDRCWWVQDIIQNLLLDHPVISQNKKLNTMIEKAGELIGKVYQEIGSIEYHTHKGMTQPKPNSNSKAKYKNKKRLQ
jgi:hypothetical protein